MKGGRLQVIPTAVYVLFKETKENRSSSAIDPKRKKGNPFSLQLPRLCTKDKERQLTELNKVFAPGQAQVLCRD